DRRRVTAAPVASAALALRPRAHLVSPVNLGLFSPRPLSDGRVVPFRPAANGFGILLVGPSQGPLGGEAPTIQVAPHGPDRHLPARPLGDQPLDRFSGPEGVRQA